MSLIAKLRANKYAAAIAEREAAYAREPSAEERHAWQLAELNKTWAVTSARVPHWAALVNAGTLPRSFESLRQFTQLVPATTKRMVQTQINDLCDPTLPTDMKLTTGGSTGEPTTVPASQADSEWSVPDRWLGRKWWGITPHDRLFMIWGHSHLLGTGFKAKLKGQMRVLKDHLLGYHRFSAYQLDPAKLREAADILIAWKPRYIIAYSSALDYFARVNADRAPEFAKLKLAGAFGTGESYPFADSAAVISKSLGCPAGMEYGSIETSVMGYSQPVMGDLGHFRLFWRSYIFELGEPGPGGGRMMRITSLRPRKWPLVRFEIGDEVFPFAEDDATSVARVQRIIGKSLAFVTMNDGTVVHSVTFEHAVRNCKGVLRFQVVDGKDRRTLKIVAPGVDQAAVTAQVRDVMRRIHPSLEASTIEFVDQLIQTRAGKTPLVVFEDGYKPPGANAGRGPVAT